VGSLRGSATAGLNGIYASLKLLDLASLGLHSLALPKCRLIPAELCQIIVIQLHVLTSSKWNLGRLPAVHLVDEDYFDRWVLNEITL
jgi:hypothetical protein